MTPIFKKLNLKDQQVIVIVQAPQSFEPELAALEKVEVERDAEAVERIDFSLAFVTKQDEVDRLAAVIGQKAQGDATVWFAYPKGSSKRYTCEFNRDTGWGKLGEVGFEPVRQVAIDEDWSALRFRRVEYIKRLTRKKLQAISEEGKKRAGKDEA